MPDAEVDEHGEAADGGSEDEHEDPRGTMFLLLIFLLLIALMWIWAYYSLISRG